MSTDVPSDALPSYPVFVPASLAPPDEWTHELVAQLFSFVPPGPVTDEPDITHSVVVASADHTWKEFETSEVFNTSLQAWAAQTNCRVMLEVITTEHMSTKKRSYTRIVTVYAKRYGNKNPQGAICLTLVCKEAFQISGPSHVWNSLILRDMFSLPFGGKGRRKFNPAQPAVPQIEGLKPEGGAYELICILERNSGPALGCSFIDMPGAL